MQLFLMVHQSNTPIAESHNPHSSVIWGIVLTDHEKLLHHRKVNFLHQRFNIFTENSNGINITLRFNFLI